MTLPRLCAIITSGLNVLIRSIKRLRNAARNAAFWSHSATMTTWRRGRARLYEQLSAGMALAQQDAPLLTLKDAVEIALKNNYNIKLSQNNSTIASNNVTLGNAGILPVVTGDFNDNNSRQTTKQTRNDGTVNNIRNAKNSNNNYGVNLNWTIFDGFAMCASASG